MSKTALVVSNKNTLVVAVVVSSNEFRPLLEISIPRPEFQQQPLHYTFCKLASSSAVSRHCLRRVSLAKFARVSANLLETSHDVLNDYFNYYYYYYYCQDVVQKNPA